MTWTSTERTGATRLVIAVTIACASLMAIAGVWALLRPEEFADFVEFPNHEHFLHDAGAFQIGIGTGLFAALLWRDTLTTTLAAFLLANAIHAVNHFSDLDLGGRRSDPWLLAGVSLLAFVAFVAFVARLKQSGWVFGNVRAAIEPAMEPFVEQKTVLVTTYRRNGRPVATPVSVAVDGARAVFRSFDKAGKTRRLRANSSIQLTPCTTRGRPTGPALAATARGLAGPDAKRAAALLRRKHPLLHGVLVPAMHRLGRARFGRTVHFEVVPNHP